MFGSLCRLILFRFSALANLVPSRLTSRLFLSLGLSALGLSCRIISTSALAAQVTLAWDASHDSNVAGYMVYYGYASGHYEGAVDVGMQTTSTLLDLEEGQAYYFTVGSYDANGEEIKLSSEIIFHGLREDLEGERDNDDGDVADEVDATDADAEPTDDVGRRAADRQHLDADDAEEHDIVNAVERHSESHLDTDSVEARADPEVIPQSQLSIIRVSSEPLVGDGAAEATIDGRVETFWHTEMGEKAPSHPHELVIALGGDYVVKGFRYLPRQDGKIDGMVTRYSFYVSEDEKDWGELAATGTFSRDITEKEVVFPGKMGSFVRFVAHAEVHGRPWTSMAEISILLIR